MIHEESVTLCQFLQLGLTTAPLPINLYPTNTHFRNTMTHASLIIQILSILAVVLLVLLPEVVMV